jgi:hypothetical protein
MSIDIWKETDVSYLEVLSRPVINVHLRKLNHPNIATRLILKLYFFFIFSNVLSILLSLVQALFPALCRHRPSPLSQHKDLCTPVWLGVAGDVGRCSSLCRMRRHLNEVMCRCDGAENNRQTGRHLLHRTHRWCDFDSQTREISLESLTYACNTKRRIPWPEMWNEIYKLQVFCSKETWYAFNLSFEIWSYFVGFH